MLKIKKENKKTFEILGLIKDPLWKNIKCVCGTTKDKQFPLISCLNCKFQIQEDSIPKKSFKSNGKDVNTIKIVRGRFEDIIGWTWEQ